VHVLSRHDSVGAIRVLDCVSVAATLLCGLLLAGCATEPPHRYADVPEATATQNSVSCTGPAISRSETLRVGDSLTLGFSDRINPPFGTVRISQDGTITLFWNQTFIAAGKTPSELEREIRARYAPGLPSRDGHITIIAASGPGYYYFVRGEVQSEGRYHYSGPATVLKTIAFAGGFTDFAKKSKVRLIRPDGSKSTIDCAKATEHPELDLAVSPGDIIFVPRRIL